VRLVLVLLLLTPLAVACGGEDEADVPSELVGTIVEIQSSDDGTIASFTLEAGEDVHTIHIAEDVEYGFDLAHLHEHRATGEPVRCVLEEREGRLYALEIVDAPAT
jgi:hypothetical protein